MKRKTEDLFKKISEASRYKTSAAFGLTQEQVQLRNAEGLFNVTERRVNKTYLQIIAGNILSFFNILLFIIAGFLMAAGSWGNLFFLIILIANIGFGMFQDIRARRLLDKMRLITAKMAVVIREGRQIEIDIQEVVLDDVVVFNAGEQIFIDSTVIHGKCSVDESALTGESRNIDKAHGDTLFSGTYVKSGQVHARVEKLGKTNYIETLQNKAKNFSRPKSEIIRSLNLLFLIIGVVVIVLGGILLIINLTYPMHQGPLFDHSASDVVKQVDYNLIITAIAGSMVSMIPAGMYLLTSVALTTSVISLSKHKTAVNELYSIEMLSRVDVICFDKTGTLTDGTLKVEDTVPFGRLKKEAFYKELSEFVQASTDTNVTAKTLREHFTATPSYTVDKTIPFLSENKFSAISFVGKGTYVLGAAEMIKGLDRETTLLRAQQYSSKGYRVLGFFHSSGRIEKENVLPKQLKCLGLVVMSDHIKEDAQATIKWFIDNGVDIKILSGDNAQAVSIIARQTGIKDSDKFISMENQKPEDVVAQADQNTVFGRVTPEQKELIIESLRKTHTVAMVGDGVNDILALKRADCSIAMASGSEAARDAAHLVLLDSNFSSLPKIVGEGRRVINNLQRTCALFLSKTFFAILLTIGFIILSFVEHENYRYPFEPKNMMIWEVFTIGIAAFLLALQPSHDKIQGKFLANTIQKAFPASLALFFGVFVILLCETLGVVLQPYVDNYIFKDITDSTKMTLLVSTVSFCSIAILFRICLPFNKYRLFVFLGLAFATIGAVLLFGLIPLQGLHDMIGVNFLELVTKNNLLLLLLGILLITIPWYLGLDFIFDQTRRSYKQLRRKNQTLKEEARDGESD
ncbi:MAG: HAD-IC family P-type ATPase [Erysipelotrichaceae bacterium]|jgi:cation-transporting ATPase E|nr:HAD-IC family P-type ATPase [Erysipelotrichaceae bacterium]